MFVNDITDKAIVIRRLHSETAGVGTPLKPNKNPLKSHYNRINSTKVINKNKRELDTALIKPIHPHHQFSSNGLYMMIGKPGSGKTYYILKHILLSEKLFDKPYYNLIVFCSTSNGLDKTVLAFKDKIKTADSIEPPNRL